MVLGKLALPGPPTDLDKGGSSVHCACNRCGWGLFGVFSLSLSLSLSLWETARYRLRYCLKGPLNTKQPTNQINGFNRLGTI